MEEVGRIHPDLIPRCRAPGIAFMAMATNDRGPVVVGKGGIHGLADGEVKGNDPLACYSPNAPGLIATSLSYDPPRISCWSAPGGGKRTRSPHSRNWSAHTEVSAAGRRVHSCSAPVGLDHRTGPDRWGTGTASRPEGLDCGHPGDAERPGEMLDDTTRFTVMTANLGNGLAPDNQVIAALRDSGADVIALQELNARQAHSILPASQDAYPALRSIRGQLRGPGTPQPLPDRHHPPLSTWCPAGLMSSPSSILDRAS